MIEEEVVCVIVIFMFFIYFCNKFKFVLKVNFNKKNKIYKSNYLNLIKYFWVYNICGNIMYISY